MIMTTDFLNINGSIRCINVFVLMLIGFCSFVFILSNICIQGGLHIRPSSLNLEHILQPCELCMVYVDYEVGSHGTPTK